jgi:hypothetical protein
MTTVDYIQALISECSTYEEGLASQLAEVRQNAPDRVGCLVDLIDGLRQVKAQLIAAGAKTSTEQYAEALHIQTMKRSRRAEQAAALLLGVGVADLVVKDALAHGLVEADAGQREGVAKPHAGARGQADATVAVGPRLVIL